MIKNLISEITTTRDQMAALIVQAIEVGHAIANDRQALQLTEDAIINEIWANEAYKNDRQRQEAKHMARMNDERLLAHSAMIKAGEITKAKMHGQVLTLQSQHQMLMLTFEHTLLGERKPVVTVKQIVEKTSSFDLSELLDLVQKPSLPVIDESPAAEHERAQNFAIAETDEILRQRAARIKEDTAEAVDAGYIVDPTLSPEDQQRYADWQEFKRKGIEKLMNSEGDHEAEIASMRRELSEQEKAPKGSWKELKKPEKLGGVRF